MFNSVESVIYEKEIINWLCLKGAALQFGEIRCAYERVTPIVNRPIIFDLDWVITMGITCLK